jgi:hypothetical protein
LIIISRDDFWTLDVLRPLTIVMFAGAMIAIANQSDARSLRNGSLTVCSVFDHHPCMPTACSVFDRNPCVPDAQYGIGQDLHLTVESDHSSSYQMPDHDLNTIGDLFAALRACWQPPALDAAREGMQMSIRFSFNRSGNPIAPPRSTFVTRDAPQDARQLYRDSIDAAFGRCVPLHFTSGLAGAIAGRPIAIHYVENRSVEGQSQP